MHTASSNTPPDCQTRPAKRQAKIKRRPAHTKLDGRSWEYRLLLRTREDLAKHVGGAPSATQKALIDRAAWLTVYLAQQDARTATGEFMSEHMSRQYLSWSNSLVRAMKGLGFKGSAQQPTTLREHLAQRAETAA